MHSVFLKRALSVLCCCGIVLVISLHRGFQIKKFIASGKMNMRKTFRENYYTMEENIYMNAGNIMQRSRGKWNVLKSNNCSQNKEFVLAHLRKPNNTPIFVYRSNIDKHVSASIISKGHYEGPWVDRIIGFLNRFPNAVFLDVGANVGMFSITVAALGHHVVAIDCLDENIMRLCASMKVGNLTKQITIVYNAVSDKHEKVTLGRYRGDVGGTFVQQGVKDGAKHIDTILLDDLLEVFTFKQVVMKMDVEKLENKVLKGAYKFFEQVRVEALLMEFIKHRYSERGRFIVNFLSKFGLRPEVPNNVKSDYRKWEINNILFKRT